MAKKKGYKDDLTFIFYINIVVIVLLLTMFNLYNFRQKKITVLGAETNNDFWQEMITKHPTYRDAWIELGRLDKVEEIDPNF